MCEHNFIFVGEQVLERTMMCTECRQCATPDLVNELEALQAHIDTLEKQLAEAVKIDADDKEEFDWGVLDEMYKYDVLKKAARKVPDEIVAEYPLEGNYQDDARYVWPKRWRTLKAKFMLLLDGDK